MTNKDKPITRTVLGFGYRTQGYTSRRNPSIPEGFLPVPGVVERWVNRDGDVLGAFGRILKASLRKDGYLGVKAKSDGVFRDAAVHRMVASVYCAKPDGCDVVNHKNGIKTDNRADNLEWVTPKGNFDHAVLTGLTQMKLTDRQVAEIRSACTAGVKHKDIAVRYGVSRALIWRISVNRARRLPRI